MPPTPPPPPPPSSPQPSPSTPPNPLPRRQRADTNAGGGGHCPVRGGRALIVSSDASRAASLSPLLARIDLACVQAGSLSAARAVIQGPQAGAEPYRLVLVDMELPDGSGLDLMPALREAHVATLLVSPSATLDEAVAAIRSGASDLLAGPIEGNALLERVAAALRQFEPEPDCVREPAGAPAEPSDARPTSKGGRRAGPKLTGPAAEFQRLIRNELDIESLLRKKLEFILARTGPTNGAVFLPGASGDFSLGAYVNYDCPKDTAEVLLDHLANAVAPRFERHERPVLYTDPAELEDMVGDSGQWLQGSSLLAIPCRHAGECLAIALLFRDRGTPFPPALVQALPALADLFAAQLARVIQVHHRHLPKDKWGMPGDPVERDDEDSGGLAA
ncbi:MAG: response regulator [Phycisphaerae bacterium]|nr:response regulator [Phycisphaerae bacterium]